MKKISSASNQLIKIIASLKSPKGRQQHNLFIAEGWRTCLTLLQAHRPLEYCLTTENLYDHALQHVDTEKIILISDELLKKLSQTTTPSGVIGVFQLPPSPAPEQLRAGIVLAQISDPGNMGTLIRTCAALGKKTIVIVEGVDPWSLKVVQASAGTIGQVTIFQLSWHKLIAHKKDLITYALVVHAGKKPSIIAGEKALLVIGNEAHGLPTEWKKECDEHITIPMPGNTESLNAAVAGSIAMYLTWIKNS